MPKVTYRNLNNINRDNFTPISDFIESKNFRDNRLWRIVDGKLSVFLEGGFISKEDFENRYPLKNPVSFTHAPENADHTKDFLR